MDGPHDRSRAATRLSSPGRARPPREPVTITIPDGSTPDGRDELVVLSAEEYARLKRRDRRVGLSEEWVEAARNAKVPDEFAALDTELK